MNAQQSGTACGLAEEPESHKEHDIWLPLSQQNCPRSLKASVSFDHEQTEGDPEQSSTSPCLKRSHSFLIALSDSAVLFKPNGECAPPTKETQNLSFPPPNDTRHSEEPLASTQQAQQNSCLSLNSEASDEPVCRICHEGEDNGKLVSPCYCSGSVGLLHLTCLERWLGASHSTRCELCKYEFTLKRLPRALTEFIRDPPSIKHRNNLVCDLACFVVLTPVTISSAYLCGSGVQHYAQWPDSWQVQGLYALTICLVFMYLTWLVVAMHHHYNICKKWRAENPVVKITYISPVKSKRTVRSVSLASCKPDPLTSPWGSVGDRGSHPHPSLVATPVLRPILRYSTQLKATSWHSGLNESVAIDLGLPLHHSPDATSGPGCQSVFRTRHETYV